MGRQLKDPELVRYGQVKANINGYQLKAFVATREHFKINSDSELAKLWLMEPEHPLTIRTRSYFYSILEKEQSGLVAEFWSSFSSV